MAKRIRAIRQTTVTHYADDGSVSRTIYRVSYKKEDTDDTGLSAWVEVDAPALDQADTCAGQRDAMAASAKAAEGITTRG
tara:strand:- start:1056 stop:1295 length:240 start_codon:yes stop_codon:yes gene_type:complete